MQWHITFTPPRTRTWRPPTAIDALTRRTFVIAKGLGKLEANALQALSLGFQLLLLGLAARIDVDERDAAHPVPPHQAAYSFSKPMR